MSQPSSFSRRHWLATLGKASAAGVFLMMAPSYARAAGGKVVVIGGGFGGGSVRRRVLGFGEGGAWGAIVFCVLACGFADGFDLPAGAQATAQTFTHVLLIIIVLLALLRPAFDA